MLRLNSQHARTYFNQNATFNGHMDTHKRGQGRSQQQEGYGQNQMSYNPQPQEYKPQISQRRFSFTSRNQPKFQISREETDIDTYRCDYQKIPLQSNQQNPTEFAHRFSYKQPPIIRKREDIPLYQNPNCINYPKTKNFDKRNDNQDYLARHSKRNERIRNSLYRDSQPEWDQGYALKREHQTRQVTSFKDDIMKRGLDYNRRESDQAQTQSNRSHYYRNSYETNQFQGYEQRDPQQRSDKKQDSLYCLDSDRISSIRRQKQPSYEFTPDKKQHLSSVPGSAQRKQSLIEKSQELQKKLKSINGSSTGSPSLQNNNTFQSRYEYGKRYQGRYQSRPSVYSVTNTDQSQRKPVCSQNTSPQKMKSKKLTYQSKDLQKKYENPPNQALDKISQLNEKISQRIQSIISNYAKQ